MADVEGDTNPPEGAKEINNVIVVEDLSLLLTVSDKALPDKGDHASPMSLTTPFPCRSFGARNIPAAAFCSASDSGGPNDPDMPVWDYQ